jgi:filamentous hemagglutinin family protein
MRHTRLFIAVISVPFLCFPGSGRAQGAGTTGATVLQMLAGGRASALSGAYTAAGMDADVLFYNPAGAAGLNAAASVSYQQHVEDIGLATGAGAFRFGNIVLGASAIFLDYGDIQEYVPDPDFGGQTGIATGNTVSASEVAARLTGALPLSDGRFNLGASLGYVSSDLAGTGRGTPFIDVGGQLLLSGVTIGAALRNIGGSLSGSGVANADLPREARLGAMYEFARDTGLGGAVSVDLVAGLNGGSTGLVGGFEAGLLPKGASQIGAVARAGYDTGVGDGGQGALAIGGGVSLGPIAVDYTYQNYDLFGSLHRVGVRWIRLP